MKANSFITMFLKNISREKKSLSESSSRYTGVGKLEPLHTIALFSLLNLRYIYMHIHTYMHVYTYIYFPDWKK